MEKASLEEPDSELIETWAQLLIAASTGKEMPSPRMVSVLSELTPENVRMLKKLTTSSRVEMPLSMIEDTPFTISRISIEADFVRESKKLKTKSPQEIFEFCVEQFERPGGLLVNIFIGDEKPKSEADEDYFDFSREDHDTGDEGNLSILESLGLVKREWQVHKIGRRYEVTLVIVTLTEFGVQFLTACDADVSRAMREARAKLELRIQTNSAMEEEPAKLRD